MENHQEEDKYEYSITLAVISFIAVIALFNDIIEFFD